MDIDNIDLDNLNFTPTKNTYNVNYLLNDKKCKIKIKLPLMFCPYKIDEFKDSKYLKMYTDDTIFIDKITKINNKIKNFLKNEKKDENSYKDLELVKYYNEKPYLVGKILYRYNKYEITIKDRDNSLLSIFDIVNKDNYNMEGVIEYNGLWNYNNKFFHNFVVKQINIQ